MNTTEIYCDVDDFCKVFIPEWEEKSLKIKQRQRKFGGDNRVVLFMKLKMSN